MRSNFFLSIIVLSFFLCGLGCGETRIIIVRTSDTNEKLIQILLESDPDSKYRNHRYAAKYLGKRRERSAIPILIQTVIHPDEQVVREAITALGRIGQEHPDSREIIARTYKPLLSRFETRDTAERALNSWGEKKNGISAVRGK